ncbi:MAG: N-acetylmuramoyl-L-alanine amidase [Chloroflexota bacterium]|nr:N-acetylmuramoyl-L-alanine amidase [Chloroflexota bacterium]
MPYGNEPPRDDSERRAPDWNDQPDDEAGVPASVAFMDMMRRAAAKNQPPTPEPPPAADVLPVQAYRPQPATPDAATAVNAAMPAEVRARTEVRRVQRRARRRKQEETFIGGVLRLVIIVVVAGGLTATIFTWFTPPALISQDVRDDLSAALATDAVSSGDGFATFVPTAAPTPNWLKRIGIVSGHRGGDIYDPGAVCLDGSGNAVRPNENDINFSVAEPLVNNLRAMGYTVDLLDEFDPRLNNYQAAALVSIHANTCQEWPGGEVVSGFLIAGPAARTSMRGNDDLLVGCIAQYYGAIMGMQRREGVTRDMTDYHNFREVHPQTPAAIIELGFMLADWDKLTTQPDLMAQAIQNGILCFVDPSLAPPVPVTGG